MPLIYLVAGEQSGDALGARLMAALHQARPDLSFAGIGGPLMTAQGLAPLFPMRELAVMGLLEVLPKLRHLAALLRSAAEDIAAKRPDVLVTIDSPGFTLRLLERVKHLGLKRAHYVAPQVWGWRESRVKKFPGLWDRLLCLLPFEPAYFARHGLAAEFVGHPVLESGADTGDAARFRATHAIAPTAPILILMPGSRRSEVTRLLPIFGQALALLADGIPGIVPVVPVASAVAETVTAAAANWPAKPIVVTDLAAKHDAFAAANAALTKSGTSTLELAMAGVPMAVAYRVNPLTAAIAKLLVRVKYAAMVNLLADREVVPEMIQWTCTPERLATEIARLLTDPATAATQRAAYQDILASLHPASGKPPAAAAADSILALLNE